MRSALILAKCILVLLCTPTRAVEQPALPDLIMTTGAGDPTAMSDIVCSGTTRTRRHISTVTKAAVLAYNVPDAESPFYEIDDLIPLAIGGANVVANLWPQPWAVQKDALEVELRRRVFHGRLPQAEAQREIVDDWTVVKSAMWRSAIDALVPQMSHLLLSVTDRGLGLRHDAKRAAGIWGNQRLHTRMHF